MIEQHLYNKQRIVEFKEYMVQWMSEMKRNQISKKDRSELIDKYNQIFNLEIGE